MRSNVKRIIIAGWLCSAATLSARAQTACGNTLTWQDPSCQQIAEGTLSSSWTVISRHGEYAQQETECNIPSQVSVAGGTMTITASAQNNVCGDFNVDGTQRTQPATWPYATGDIQWNTASFQYGTVTIHGRMPAVNTSLWPAFWLLGTNCQDANKFSGDTGFGGCPNLGQGGYREIDMVECYGASGFCQFHVANPNFGIGNGCDATWPVDSNWHTFQTVWTPTKIQQYMDGVLETTCNQAITGPMFFIAQIQTGGAGGTPNNANLPATMQIQSVLVQDQNNQTVFFDDFTQSSETTPPTAPTDLSLAGATTSSFMLSWSPSTDDGGVAGYRLDVSTDPTFGSFISGYTNKDLGNVASALISGLSPATTYFVQLRAYDTSNNTSANSAAASGVTSPILVPPTIQLIQKNVKGNENATANMAVSFTSDNAAGNTLIVTGSAARPASPLTISDTAGNTYSVALGPVSDPDQDVTTYIWTASNCKGGPNTVTITPPSSAALEIHVSEWSGLAADTLVDQTASATGNSATLTTPTETTTSNGELIFGYSWVLNTASAGAGFTPLSLVNGDLDEYQIQNAAGPATVTFKESASGPWLALLATFRGGPSVPDTTPPSVPTQPAFSNPADSSLTLSWTASTDNVAVAGYRMDVSIDPAFGSFVTGYNNKDVGNLTSALISGLTAATTYYARLRAYDASDNISSSSVVASAVTLAPAPPGAIQLLQKASAITSSALNLTAAFPTSISSGSLIVASVSSWPNKPAATAIKDSHSNAFILAGAIRQTSGKSYTALYYAKNFSLGADTLTYTTSGSSGGQMSLAIAEFSGINVSTTPLDASAGGSGSSATPTSGNMAPSVPGDLVIGAGTHDLSTVTTAGAGFTMIAVATEDGDNHQTLDMEYELLSGTPAVAATFTLAASAPWAQAGALFKAASLGPPDTTPPTVPTQLSLTNPTTSSLTLSWTASTDDVGVAGYRLDVSSDPAFGGFITGYDNKNLGNVTSTLISGLAPGATYFTQLRAYDAAGNTSASSVAASSVTLPVVPDTTPPSVPMNLAFGNATSSSLTLSWSASIDDVAVAGYRLDVSVDPDFGSFVTGYNNQNLGNVTSTLVSGLSAAATYYARLRAYDTSNNISSSSVVAAGMTQASAPPGAIQLLQEGSAIATTAKTLTAAFRTSLSSGSLIVASVSSWPNKPAAAAISDSHSNAFILAGAIQQTSGKSYTAIYYAKNFSLGGDTLTFTTGGSSGGQMSLAISEFSGVDLSTTPIDGTAGAHGSSSAPSSGSMTPSAAGDLVIGAGTHDATTVTTAGIGFSMIVIATEDGDSHQSLAMEYQVLAGASPLAATFSLAASAPWAQAGALFKAASQGVQSPAPHVIPAALPDSTHVSSEAVLSMVRVYPNPWRSDQYGRSPITFDHLPVNTTIKIFTVSGHWVKTLPISSSSTTWDLNNSAGDHVASGLYIYLLTADGGLKKTGQIAVIR